MGYSYFYGPENQYEKSIGESRFFHIGDFLRQLHLNIGHI
jgi:hypothetical protein